MIVEINKNLFLIVHILLSEISSVYPIYTFMASFYHIPSLIFISLEVEHKGGSMLNEKYQALLDQYDISVSHTRRGRGCVLCFGENDVYALSQTSLSEERLGAVSEWTLAMHDHHFYKTDQYILNKDGYFLTFDRYYETFALRKTYLGTECDIHALKDIRSSAENLASFHNHCLAISFSSENLRKYTSISTYYEQKYLELKSIARYIRKRKKKGVFEYLFLEQTKTFWKQMERSIQILNETTPSRRGWCHGAYNHHNIIMTSSAPATIHFEHFYHGYPILDVYYFLKKALEKNNYNFAFCETFLSNYDRFMPLSKDDLLCLYGLFLFPEKFWKISNQYMAHKKHWISPRYIEKLEEFIHNKEARSIFLEKYVQIYNVFS